MHLKRILTSSKGHEKIRALLLSKQQKKGHEHEKQNVGIIALRKRLCSTHDRQSW
jgi:hypothetical protein